MTDTSKKDKIKLTLVDYLRYYFTVCQNESYEKELALQDFDETITSILFLLIFTVFMGALAYAAFLAFIVGPFCLIVGCLGL